jgi:hypothetical protein
MCLHAREVVQLACAARPRVPQIVEDAGNADGDEVSCQEHAIEAGDVRVLGRLPAAWREPREPPQDVRAMQAVRRAPEAMWQHDARILILV